ncbi:uncharacterized protein LOC134068067 [Sardina pilchardus]|uniref:uncharacterized protein LOC134068067 n=1 Tax=Sardina pilchardus TaxID=27697 RepID=UPI002E0FAC38
MNNFTEFTTSAVKAIDVTESLGVQCILPIMTDLGHKGLLDSVLKSNLDYAMKAVEALPISKRTNALLDVSGQKTFVSIRTGFPELHYTVWSDSDGPKLLLTVTTKNTKLTTKDIDKSYFAGHCCRDELKSCMKQAHEIVASKEKKGGLSNVELKIMCGELRLTFITQSPSTTIEVRPEWRAKIKNYNLLDVPGVMNNMEKSGEMSPSMLACFHYFLKNYRKNVCTASSAHILLMSEGQKVELFFKDQSGWQDGTNDVVLPDNIVIFIGANNCPEMIHDRRHY